MLDRVVTDRPRTVETYWHFHPECTVIRPDSLTVTTNENEGDIRLRASDADWEIELVEGQDEPYLQGWYSRENNRLVEVPVAVARQEVDDTVTFA